MNKQTAAGSAIPKLSVATLNAQPSTDVIFTAIVKSYTQGMTRKQKPYVSGTIADNEKQMPFKIWDTAVTTDFMAQPMENQVCVMHGIVNEYNGMLEIHVDRVCIAEGVDMGDFVRTCNTNQLYTEFVDRLHTLPVEWQEVVAKVFNTVPVQDVWQKFSVAYAASGYHDALKSGLIHHTVKMLRLLDTVIANDERLRPFENILKTGIILHDLGKIEEMVDGVYTPDSYVNHRMRGMGYVMQSRDYIVERIGMDNYNHLCSIMLEHHGGLQAEPMHTVYALIVFVIDNLDAQATFVADSMDNNLTGKFTTMPNGVKAVRYDTSTLVY